MATYVKTVWLGTLSRANAKDREKKVNTALKELQSRGAKICDVKVWSGFSSSSGAEAVCLITYESSTSL